MSPVRIVSAGIAGVVVSLVVLTVAVSALSGDVGDSFPAVTYNGNTGTLDWAGPWVEMGEPDGPTVGVVGVVTSNRCSAGNCLRIGGDPADAEGRGVWREVDLAGASSAVLSFSYRREVALSTGSVSVAVSGDGGGTWIDLATYDFAGASNEFAASFDISPYAAANMRVRFLGAGSAVTGYLHFDDVVIAAVLPDVATTTTTTTATAVTSTTATAVTTTTAATTTTSVVTSTTAATTTSTTTKAATSASTTTTTMAEAIAATGTPTASAGGVVGSLRRLTPMKDLTVVFVTTVEVLGENALSGVILGVLVGWLAILGIDRRAGKLLRGWWPRPSGTASSSNTDA